MPIVNAIFLEPRNAPKYTAGGSATYTVPLGPGVHGRIPFATGIEEYPIFLKTLVLTKNPTEGSSLTPMFSPPGTLITSLSLAPSLAPASAPCS